MSNEAEKPTSGTVAHEAETIRANLAHTLQQLRENLKPEHVIEEVIDNARIGADTLADSLYSMARENPLPSLLIGAGCAMVLGLGTKKPSWGRNSVLSLRSTTRPVARLDPMAVAGVRASSLNSTRLVKPAPTGAGGAKRSHDPLLTKGNYAMNSSTGHYKTSGNTGSRLSGLLHDQPLILAALGVAVGAAIGTVLPITVVEDEWMGEASSSVKHAARDAARAEIDGLKAVASQTADSLKQAI